MRLVVGVTVLVGVIVGVMLMVGVGVGVGHSPCVKVGTGSYNTLVAIHPIVGNTVGSVLGFVYVSTGLPETLVYVHTVLPLEPGAKISAPLSESLTYQYVPPEYAYLVYLPPRA